MATLSCQYSYGVVATLFLYYHMLSCRMTVFPFCAGVRLLCSRFASSNIEHWFNTLDVALYWQHLLVSGIALSGAHIRRGVKKLRKEMG